MDDRTCDARRGAARVRVVLAIGVLATAIWAAATPPPAEAAPADEAIVLGGYVPMSPTRVLDTRLGLGAPREPLRGGATLELKVAGIAGVPADATAVMLNLTGIRASAKTYVTVWPAGRTRPTASNLNLRAGENRANAVAIGVGTGGRIALFNFDGATELVVDVTGYMLPPDRKAAGFVSLPPDRLLDTRIGLGAPKAPVSSGNHIEVQVTGRVGVPAGATAAVLNVTATRATSTGYVTVWPSDVARPVASNLNVTAGNTVPNLVVATLSPNGKVSLYHEGGQVDLIADVLGYFSDSVVAAAGSFVPITPTRVEDTREQDLPVEWGPVGAIDPDGVHTVWLSDASLNEVGTVALPPAVSAVVVNVTAVGAGFPGFLTAFPGGESGDPIPPTSTLNVVEGDTVPNLAIVPITDPSVPSIRIYNSGGRIDVLVDVVGYITDEARTGGGVEPGLWWTGNGAVAGDGSLVAGAVRDDVAVVVRCTNRSCTQRSVVELDETTTDGQGIGVDVAIGNDGLPRLLVSGGTAPVAGAYSSRSFFVRCLDAACTSRTTTAFDGSAQLALAPNGRGVLLRTMKTWSSLLYPVRLDRCANDDCSSLVAGGAVLEPNDFALDARFSSSMLSVDASGRPVVLHSDDGVAMLLRCADAACTSNTDLAIPVVDPSPAPKVWGQPLTYWFDAADRPVVVWRYPVQAQNPIGGGWFTLYVTTQVVSCGDAACATATTRNIASATGTGITDARSATRTAAGTPVVLALEDLTTGSTGSLQRARLVSCTDSTCAATASAALAFDGSSIDSWRVVPDPNGGLYFVEQDGNGLRFSHLGPL